MKVATVPIQQQLQTTNLLHALLYVLHYNATAQEARFKAHEEAYMNSRGRFRNEEADEKQV